VIGAARRTVKSDLFVGEADSNSNQCKPAPVSAGRFSLFRHWILDHRDRELRWNGSQEKTGSVVRAVPFQNLRERFQTISMHDIRLVGLLVAPVLVGYVAVMSLIAIAGPASRWLLPKYFGPDSNRLRTVEEMLTGVALGTGFYFFTAVVVYFAFRLWCWKWVTPEMARSTLRRGKCAACKYPVSNLPPGSDGCTVCPECGAAWKLHWQLPNGVIA